MAEKTLNTRIQLKYDTYSNWTTKNPVLKAGEMAIATIASGNTQEVNSVTAPQVLIKVGDGTSNYNALPFVSAKSADVYSWAKAEKKPTYEASEITGISAYIAEYVETEMGISVDTDTQYQIVAGSDSFTYKLQSKGKGDDAWADVSTITIPKTDISGKVDKVDGKSLVSDTEITKLAGVSEGANKVEASTTNGKIKIDGVETTVYTHPDKHTISDVTNLQTTLDGKVDKVTGKGLSANDLTDALKGNYDAAYTHSQSAHAPSNAQANVIETVKVNGTALTPSSKAVDITVPTEAQIKSIAATEINTIVGGVSSTDTIENITTLVNYVNEHGADTAALVSEVYGSSETTGTSRIDTLESNVRDLTQDVETNAQNIEGLDTRLDTAEQHLADAESDIDTLTQTTDRHTEEIDTLTQKVTTLNGADTVEGSVAKTVKDALVDYTVALQHNTESSEEYIVVAEAETATTAEKDGRGNTITATYETKTDATSKLNTAKSYTDTEIGKIKDGTYTAQKADIANLATTAENANNDGDGNVIKTTYAKNADLAAIAKTGNVNDLVQTTGDVLIFNCGNATF